MKVEANLNIKAYKLIASVSNVYKWQFNMENISGRVCASLFILYSFYRLALIEGSIWLDWNATVFSVLAFTLKDFKRQQFAMFLYFLKIFSWMCLIFKNLFKFFLLYLPIFLFCKFLKLFFYLFHSHFCFSFELSFFSSFTD